MTSTGRTRRSILRLVLASVASPPVFATDGRMRIFITGSTDGLGRAAALTLIDAGHQVVLHARSRQRAEALADLAPRAAGVVVGDLASAAEIRSLAEQVNEVGRMHAVIHNAGIYREPVRGATPEGHARVLAVNTLAPYLLTALMERPDRLVYLSSGMHRGGSPRLDGMVWSGHRVSASYSDSKLFVTTLAAAVARRWPEVFSNSVDPGWVPTKMGGPNAPGDLRLGHLTQEWLATSDAPEACTSGGYWHHQRRIEPHASVHDVKFQDRLLGELARATNIGWRDERDSTSQTRGER